VVGERWSGTDRALWTPEHVVDEDVPSGWVQGGQSQLFRHEERGADAVASFPRSHLLHIQSARASKPSRHARERANKKARKEAEREAAVEALKAAKNEGKRELFAAIADHAAATGRDDINFDNVLAGTVPSTPRIDAAVDHYLSLDGPTSEGSRFRYTVVEPLATGRLDAKELLEADDEVLERILPMGKVVHTYD
jgi:hypothetical protein